MRFETGSYGEFEQFFPCLHVEIAVKPSLCNIWILKATKIYKILIIRLLIIIEKQYDL